jgi:hypothetical protein
LLVYSQHHFAVALGCSCVVFENHGYHEQRSSGLNFTRNSFFCVADGKFFESEFGSVLLANANVNLEGDVHGKSQRSFPLLAEGYEIVVRGLLDENQSPDTLRMVTTAATRDGLVEWTANAVPTPWKSEAKNSRCFQSYAHARITQLMH